MLLRIIYNPGIIIIVWLAIGLAACATDSIRSEPGQDYVLQGPSTLQPDKPEGVIQRQDSTGCAAGRPCDGQAQ